MNSWRGRVQRELAGLPRRAHLICGRLSGIDLVSELLGAPNLPALPIWVGKDQDERQLVEQLSIVTSQRLGVALATSGMSLQQAVVRLHDYQCHVGPVYLILGWAEDCASHLPIMLDSMTEGSSVLIVTSDAGKDVLRGVRESRTYSVVDGTFLQMTSAEAIAEVGEVLSESVAIKLRRKTLGEFVAFQLAVLTYLDHLTSKKDVRSEVWSSDLTSDVIIDGLLHRELWSAAFDFVCSFAIDRLPDILEKAGDHFFDAGEHEYLFRRLSLLPDSLRSKPSVAYWYFAAASAIGKQWLLFPSMRAILAKDEAPNLRAVVAISRPGRNTLDETARALAASENPITMRAHGFALGFSGEYDAPIMLFNDAIKMANLDGNSHLAIAIGLDIAQLKMRRGRFADAIAWATWALEELERRGVRDRMRRLSALATLAYVELIVGDVRVAKQHLVGVSLSNDEIRVPGMEALLTTIGDVHVIQGEYELAEEMYRTHSDSAPIDVSATASLDLVMLEMARGRFEVATRYADYAMVLSETASPYEQAVGQLAKGMVQIDRDNAKAEAILTEAMESFRDMDCAVPMAQAVIWLALAFMCRGDVDSASRVLLANVGLLEQLSSSGWVLLGARHKRLKDVQTLFHQCRSSAQIKMLQARHIRLDDERIELTLKQGEIVALLALHPGGLTCERLHDLQSGGLGESNTTKVAVSRLRKELPVSTSPYRLTVPFKADFIEVSKLLDAGELQKALNLYTGALLPESDAPAIVEHRQYLEESLRQAALDSKDSDALIQLGTVLDDDLEIWLAARAHLPPGDYRGSAISARIRRIQAGW